MSDRDAFEHILASLYEAMLDDTHWPATSALIDEACGLTGNSLLVGEGPPDDIRVLFVGLYYRGHRRTDLEREYLEVYHPINEAIPRQLQLPEGHLVQLKDLYTAEELKTSPAYNEAYLRGKYQNGLNVLLEGPGGSHMTWSLADPVASDGWGSSQIAMVRRLLPHIRQFVRVRQALMQIQLDPNIPTNLTPEDMRDFKTFLATALDSLTTAAGGEIFTLGNQMLGMLALIVVVLTGLKIAFSGNIQPWELVRVVIGIWIPWVMLQFYTTTIPGMAFTFPGMIVEGGNWLNALLVDDSVSSIQTELTELFSTLAKAQNAAIEAGDLVTIVTSGLQGAMTAIAGFVMVIFMALMLMLLAAVTYAQVIWAQVALSILIILGPIFIPFLVFEPLAFLFWGWFRAMLTYSFYAVIAGAVLRVFSAVGIAYVTTLGQANLDMSSFMQVGMWTLAVVPFFIAGMLASLKCGELASMLVSGGGAGGSGLMGMVSTAGMAAASGGTAAAAKVGAGGMK